MAWRYAALFIYGGRQLAGLRQQSSLFTLATIKHRADENFAGARIQKVSVPA